MWQDDDHLAGDESSDCQARRHMEPAKQTARLFKRTKVMDMRTLEAAAGQRSRRSLFRDLVRLGYFSSYSHSGRYLL